MKRKTYTREELISFIHKFVETEKRLPKQRDFLNNPSYPSNKQYIREFGSWSQVLIDLKYVESNKKTVNKNVHICRTCGKEFRAYGKRAYCSHECRYKDKTKYTKDTKGTNSQAYRKVAFRNYDWKCAICGFQEYTEYTKGTNYNKYPVILDVHHLDHDRTNNCADNLVILCPTCHALIHRKIYVNVRRHKLFKKILYEVSPVFGGKQIPIQELHMEHY